MPNIAAPRLGSAFQTDNVKRICLALVRFFPDEGIIRTSDVVRQGIRTQAATRGESKTGHEKCHRAGTAARAKTEE